MLTLCLRKMAKLQLSTNPTIMLVPCTRVFLSLIWLEIGASISSGLDTEAHAAQDSMRTLPGADLAEFNDATQIVTTPAASTQEHQPGPKQYGIIPDGLSERNDERERMRIGRIETKALIDSLQPGSDKELSEIKSELEDLYQAFKIPIIERLYPLTGLDPPITLLLPKSNPTSLLTKGRRLSAKIFQIPNNLRPAVRLNRLRPFLRFAEAEARKPSNKLVPSILAGKSLKPATKQITTDEHMISSPTVANTLTTGKGTKPNEPQSPHVSDSLHQNQLASHSASSLSSATAEISQRDKLPITVPSAPSKDSSPIGKTAVLQLLLEAKGVQLGNPPIQIPRSGVLEGDELERVKDIIVDDRIKIWNSLQDKLIELKSIQDEQPEKPKKPIFQQTFLRSLFLMGDYIFNYGLMPSKFIESIQIFDAKTVAEMVKYHIDLLFIRRRESFFDAPDSVIPELEFLTTGSTMKHFHRSIKALPAEGQKHVVYAALTITLYNIRGCFSGGILSDIFSEIRQSFRRPELLGELDSLAASLRDSAEMDHLLNKSENLPIVQLLDKLITYFRNQTWRTYQRKFEFQMIYYILEFLEDNYKPVMEAILRQKGGLTLYQKQLKFLRSYLKFYRNRLQYPSHIYEKPDMTFLELTRSDDVALTNWIKLYVPRIFVHRSWLGLQDTKPEKNFTVWMTEMISMKQFLACVSKYDHQNEQIMME
ncbi:hypothetical protein KEM48_005789 [Puccinia striiformis f. sp. tritici PST-130]|nr:hypothetical protein KEM48_005789 [Puccinia striiformis f. sp. tritici PST-130]